MNQARLMFRNLADESPNMIFINAMGKVVYANGELQVERGAGHYVNRPPFAAYYDALRKQAELATPSAVQRSRR